MADIIYFKSRQGEMKALKFSVVPEINLLELSTVSLFLALLDIFIWSL